MPDFVSSTTRPDRVMQRVLKYEEYLRNSLEKAFRISQLYNTRSATTGTVEREGEITSYLPFFPAPILQTGKKAEVEAEVLRVPTSTCISEV